MANTKPKDVVKNETVSTEPSKPVDTKPVTKRSRAKTEAPKKNRVLVVTNTRNHAVKIMNLKLAPKDCENGGDVIKIVSDARIKAFSSSPLVSNLIRLKWITTSVE